MRDYSQQNKKAWEYSAYDFWVMTSGTPAERAKQDIADPEKMLRRYAQYAMETAEAAHACIRYEVGDVLETDLEKYGGTFDVVFMEGGILHYFHDIDEFMKIMHALLKPGGKMICSDFHPFTKINDSLKLEMPVMSYFSTDIYEGEMAHARFYPEEIRRQMPKCSLRKYTVSEILNAIIGNGFRLTRFDEHPAWENEKLPGEFTAVVIRE